MKKEKIVTFYREWLSLPKDQFRILLHLARFGFFSGNLSDLCRYFSLSLQTKNKNNIRDAIEKLAAGGMISCSKSGRTYNLQIVPKENRIDLPCDWVDAIASKSFCVSVSIENVMKVLLWLLDYGPEMSTDNMIALDLGVSPSSVGEAKKVLERDFEAINRHIINVKNAKGEIRRLGQIVNVSAWLAD